MHAKYIVFIIVAAMLFLTFAGIAGHAYQTSRDENAQVFDIEKFNEIARFDEDMLLFCDVAFNRKSSRIRKWTKDIKVEIKNIKELDKKSVKEVDSLISILRPLIYPLNIERVYSGGNVLIYRNVTTAPTIKYRYENMPLKGLARLNEESAYEWEITHAVVYDAPNSGTQTLMHEFEHVLGLEHPFRLYPYYLTIGRSIIPQHYSIYQQWKVYKDIPYFISEQEKTVIKMLYSPEIKPGLKKEIFMKKMGLDFE